MAKFNVVIADCDEGYADALSKYLSSWRENDFNVISFTKEELLRKYLDSEIADVLLISPQLMAENLNLSHVQVTIINTPDRIPESLMGYPNINKYQPGDILARELIRIFSENSNDEIIIKNNRSGSVITGVYSPIGGIGKTTVSVGLAMQYALKGEKTLFISLEELASYTSLLNCNSSNNFSDLLYFMKQKNKNLMLKIEGLKNCDSHSGLYYFSPSSCYKDMQEVTSDEWLELIGYIKNNSAYDRIILDFDSTLNNKNMELFNMCNEVILLINGDNMSQSKINQMYNSLEKVGKKDLHSKVNILFNKSNHRNEITEDSSIRGKKVMDYIPYDDHLIDGSGYNRLNLTGPFGQALEHYIHQDLVEERDIC